MWAWGGVSEVLTVAVGVAKRAEEVGRVTDGVEERREVRTETAEAVVETDTPHSHQMLHTLFVCVSLSLSLCLSLCLSLSVCVCE